MVVLHHHVRLRHLQKIVASSDPPHSQAAIIAALFCPVPALLQVSKLYRTQSNGRSGSPHRIDEECHVQCSEQRWTWLGKVVEVLVSPVFCAGLQHLFQAPAR